MGSAQTMLAAQGNRQGAPRLTRPLPSLCTNNPGRMPREVGSCFSGVSLRRSSHCMDASEGADAFNAGGTQKCCFKGVMRGAGQCSCGRGWGGWRGIGQRGCPSHRAKPAPEVTPAPQSMGQRGHLHSPFQNVNLQPVTDPSPPHSLAFRVHAVLSLPPHFLSLNLPATQPHLSGQVPRWRALSRICPHQQICDWPGGPHLLLTC